MKLDIQFNSKNHQQHYNCAQVIVTEENGKKQKKTVSIHSLMEALTRSTIKEKSFSRIGAIPNGFYDGEIMSDKHEGLSASIITILPKAKQHMVFEKTPYNVCFPSLVFYFHISKNRLGYTKVFAIKDKKPGNKSCLYVYPFGNVNSYDGKVCWGSNVLPRIDSIKQLEATMSLFIQSPCNMDHYNSNSTKLKLQNLRDLLDHLKDLEEFPDTILNARRKGDRNMTIADLIKSFVG